MPELIILPCDLMRPRDATFFINWTTKSAGRRMSDGQEQVLDKGYGYWQVDYSLPLEFSQDRIKQFEAAISMLRGRRNIARICVCDPFRYGKRVSPAQQPFSDGTWFSDGTGWSDGSQVEQMRLSADAPAGAQVVFFQLTQPTRIPLRVGDMFSVKGFLYRVVDANATGWTRIEPPLRAAIPADTVVATDPAYIRVRLADDQQGRRAREMLRWGQPVTVSFVEAFER